MKSILIGIWLIGVCSIFASCKKDKTGLSEVSKLPPATETGANTFGCLINGKAWVAQTYCKYLCDAPFKLNYDASGGGKIFISSFSEILNQRMSFGFDSTNTKINFTYSLVGGSHMGFTFSDNNLTGSCSFLFSTDSITTTIGKVNLVRYDLQNGMISGTFDFTLIKSGCETIVVTEGRFDKKL